MKFIKSNRGLLASLVVLLALVMGLWFMGGLETELGWAQTPSTSNDVADINLPWAHWDALKEWVRLQDSTWFMTTPKVLALTVAEQGRMGLPVWNREGDTLYIGDCAVWDTVKVKLGDTLKVKPMRLEALIEDEGGPWNIMVQAVGTASNDSLLIYGLDEDGEAQTEILVIVDASDYNASAYTWTQIDSVEDNQSAGGWDSYGVYAVPYCGVRASDGVSYDFAGIVEGGYQADGDWEEIIPDNAEGYIILQGISKAVCDGGSTAIWPGDLLTPAAGGDFAPVANMDSSFAMTTVARALEPCTANNTTIRVMVP